MPTKTVLLLFVFSQFTLSDQDMLRGLCNPVSKSKGSFRKDVVYDFDTATEVLYEWPNSKGSKVNLESSAEPAVVIKKLQRYTDKVNSVDMQKIVVKQFKVHEKNKNKILQFSQITAEIEVWTKRKAKKDIGLLDFYDCYFEDTPNDEFLVFVLLQEFTEHMLENPLGQFPKQAENFRKAPIQTRLKTYEAIALQLKDLHDLGYIHNDLRVNHIFMQSITMEDMRGKYKSFDEFNIIFWDEKFQLPNIVDFRRCTKGREGFKPFDADYNDYETLSSEKGSYKNDIFNLGLLIAEMEFGPFVVHLDAKDDESGGFVGFFRGNNKQHKMNQRAKIIRSAIASQLHFGYPDTLSFAALLLAMLRIKQKDRLDNTGAVISWLQVLQDYYIKKLQLDEFNEAIDKTSIRKSAPNFKRMEQFNLV